MDTTKNILLGKLPQRDFDQIAAECRQTQFSFGEKIATIGERLETIHFPLSGVISIVAEYDDGSIIEMATIGREGCTGSIPLLGGELASATHLIQMEGESITLPLARFQDLLNSSEIMRNVFYAYTQSFIYQIMVSGTCNGAHNSVQRLARWLLMMDDRTKKSELKLTHDFLAAMLKVRRATVTLAIQELQDTGAISSSRGLITITSRDLLRESCCQCYDMIESLKKNAFTTFGSEASVR